MRTKRKTIAFVARMVLVSALAVVVGMIGRAEAAGPVETASLIVSDPENALSQEALARFAAKGEHALERILGFWSVGANVSRSGKIRLEFHPPRAARGVSVFAWRKENGRRVRFVGVWGDAEQAEMMVHKLTSAIFPNRDKLVRNMMGVPTEARFGNRLTSPMCSSDTDAWVLALRQAGAYIPLREFGPEHESWGMGTKGGLPVVTDKARRHAMYAESGSFGRYVIDTYGIGALKKFHKRSIKGERPWKAVFGRSLDELESDWLRALAGLEKSRWTEVSRLMEVWNRYPKDACMRARNE